MIDFPYYRKLEETAKIPDSLSTSLLSAYFESVGLGEIWKVALPAIRVSLFVSTHELALFTLILDNLLKNKYPKNYYNKLGADDLFSAFSLLGSECFGELLNRTNCSESVHSRLLMAHKKCDRQSFINTINESDINFGAIAPIYLLLYIVILFSSFYEAFDNEVNRIANMELDENSFITEMGKTLQPFYDESIKLTYQLSNSTELAMIAKKEGKESINKGLYDIDVIAMASFRANGLNTIDPNDPNADVLKAYLDYLTAKLFPIHNATDTWYKAILMGLYYLEQNTLISSYASETLKKPFLFLNLNIFGMRMIVKTVGIYCTTNL